MVCGFVLDPLEFAIAASACVEQQSVYNEVYILVLGFLRFVYDHLTDSSFECLVSLHVTRCILTLVIAVLEVILGMYALVCYSGLPCWQRGFNPNKAKSTREVQNESGML